MARETLFETQALSFVLSDFGYMYQTTPSPFELTAGESYIIVWEGQEYVRTAWAFDSLAPGTVGVGSELPAGGEADPDGLPVTIGYVPATDYAAFFSLAGEGPYSVGLYKEVAEPARLILRDPDGTEQEYPMRPMLEVDTTEGGTVLYSKGQILDGLTIQPDFSAGDMEITAPEGYLVKSAVIAKPSALVPENIAKNEVVAGVVGTHEGGGGGGAVECVEWVQIAQSEVRMQATSVSSTVTATIPKDCLGRTVLQGSKTWNGSTNITISSGGYPPSITWGESGLTVTEDDTHITFTWAKTWSNSSTNFKVKYMLLQLIVAFIMGNMYIDSSSGSNVLVGKPGLKYLPKIDPSYGAISCGTELAQIDFSKTAIEEYQKLHPDYDTTIKKVFLPACCTVIGHYAFFRHRGITKIATDDTSADYTIDLPNVKSVEYGGFGQMTLIEHVVLENCETFDTYSFWSDTALISAELPAVKSIGSSCFYGCTALKTIDMSRVSAVPTLVGSGAIPTNSGLQILVPSALYDEWIAATNWTAYADYIVAV